MENYQKQVNLVYYQYYSIFTSLHSLAKLNDLTTFNAGEEEDDVLFDEEFEDDDDDVDFD